MFTEARKLHLIEELIRLRSEKALGQIEHILTTAVNTESVSRPSSHNFLGKISKKDILLMENAIQAGCGQIRRD
jgi:hypothetical protein